MLFTMYVRMQATYVCAAKLARSNVFALLTNFILNFKQKILLYLQRPCSKMSVGADTKTVRRRSLVHLFEMTGGIKMMLLTESPREPHLARSS